jgi:hypothetical protein
MAEYIIQEKTLTDLADAVRYITEYVYPIFARINDPASLEEASIPEGVTEITNFAFEKCSNLRRVFIPEGVTLISGNAFTRCTNLEHVSFPESLVEINAYVFYGCENLRSVTFKGTPTSMVSGVFIGCKNITTINVPWAEGAVANAPWGATNATINYNYVGE